MSARIDLRALRAHYEAVLPLSPAERAALERVLRELPPLQAAVAAHPLWAQDGAPPSPSAAQ